MAVVSDRGRGGEQSARHCPRWLIKRWRAAGDGLCSAVSPPRARLEKRRARDVYATATTTTTVRVILTHVDVCVCVCVGLSHLSSCFLPPLRTTLYIYIYIMCVCVNCKYSDAHVHINYIILLWSAAIFRVASSLPRPSDRRRKTTWLYALETIEKSPF